MTSTSPLRYPGGKARFTDIIWEAMSASGERTSLFVEPFCGGSGAAIALLETGRVKRIALNDADPLIACFWKVVFGKSRKTKHDINWLIDRVESTEITLAVWRSLKASEPNSIRAAAWKCLFLNRTSFNGIIHKAGPIGGWQQKNRTLDVRFNREKLMKRLSELYQMRDAVERADCVEWKRFCARYENARGAYLYLDPPYYHRAEQLYGYLFNEAMHREMRDYLLSHNKPWILSYDDAAEVRKLYRNLPGIDALVVDQTYSTHPMGGASFVGRELFFSNRALPVHDQSRRPIRHVGLSIVGSLQATRPEPEGPTRTQISRLEQVMN